MSTTKKRIICQVCSTNEHKYKCPKCKIVYCSLDCYKTHKDNCANLVETQAVQDSTQVTPRLENVETSLDVKQIKSESVESDVVECKPSTSAQSMTADETQKSEDAVSDEQFRSLDDSEDVKKLLSNKHLRDLLKQINDTKESNIEFEMDKAMQEPLFVEFAEACLKTIRNEKIELPPNDLDLNFKF